MKLTDFEVFIQMLKFLLGCGIFARPKLYQRYGPIAGFVSDIIGVWIINFSNTNLIKCMQFMPREQTTPDSQLTYGKVVHFVLDKRD